MKNKIAPPGNRTRVARMGILHDTTTLAAQRSDLGEFLVKIHNDRTFNSANFWPLTTLQPRAKLSVFLPPSVRVPQILQIVSN